MSISSIKKILLAGTALVAVAAFSSQAQAGTDGLDVSGAATTNPGTAETGSNGTAVTGGNGFNGVLLNTAGQGSYTGTLGDAITGGTGGTNTSGGLAGSGGVGFNFGGENGILATPTSFVNAGSVVGGGGGTSSGAAGAGGNGGGAAAGILDNANFTSITGAGTITVGIAGNGSNGAVAGAGGGGGAGADAITSSGTNATISDTGNATAGTGGNGGSGAGAGAGGLGGSGGIAYDMTGTAATLTVTGQANGGGGGTGGAKGTGNAGSGGGGGAAILLGEGSGTSSITIMGTAAVLGGTGGASGTGGTGATDGSGGAGISITGIGNTVGINAGATVAGGNAQAVAVGTAGANGAGILIGGATGNVINNSGTITGGTGASAAAFGAAISDTGSTGTTTIANTATAGAAATIGSAVSTGDAIDLSTGQTIFSITNTGVVAHAATIETAGGSAIKTFGTGTITTLTNAAHGVISATTGAAITNAGTITGLNNSDTTSVISATTGFAINNTGTIGTLANVGTISATTGTAIHDAGTITNLNNSGLITVTGGGGAALDIEHSGMTLNNAGGVIDSTNVTGEAINLGADNVAGITNAGSISNTSAVDGSVALSIAHSQTGTFINTGTISSVGASGNTGKAVFFNAATAALTNSNMIIGTITDNGTANVVTLANSSAGSINGAITITDTGAGSSLTTSGTSFITGNVGFTGAAAHTFTFGSSGALTGSLTGGSAVDTLNLNAGSISGVVDLGAGANIVNVGDGTLTAESFTTSNTIQESGGGTLNTEVKSNGTFNVGNTYTAGATGTLQVDAGGTLKLTGGTFTAGALTNNGAIVINTAQSMGVASVSAGTGTDTFEVKGDGSTLVPGAAFNGTLASTGAVALTGTTIAVKIDTTGGILKNDSAYEVITASAQSGNVTVVGGAPTAITSTPTLVATTGVDKFYAVTGAQTLSSGFGSDVLVGTTNDIYLVAVQQSLTTLGSAITANDAALFTALSTASAADAACVTTACTQLKTAIAAVNTAAGVSATAAHNALQALMPAGADGGAQSAALDVGADIQSIENGRTMALRDGDTTSGVAAGVSSHGVSMWAEGYGQHANQDMMDGVNGYGATTWGGAVGVDTSSMFEKAIVGVAINYGHSAIDSSDANSTVTDLGNYGVNLYGTYDLGQRMFVNGQAGFAYNTIDSTRHNVGGPGVNADGSTSSDQYSARLDTGRDYPVANAGGLTLTPDVSAAYTYLNTAGYTETGAGGLDNTVASNSQNVLGLGIGGTAAWKMHTPDDDVLKPSLHVGYTYEAIDDRVNTSSTFTGDPAGTIFINEGSSPARSIFDLGAKVVYATKANWDFSANYDFQAKTDYTSNTGELRATAHF